MSNTNSAALSVILSSNYNRVPDDAMYGRRWMAGDGWQAMAGDGRRWQVMDGRRWMAGDEWQAMNGR